MGVTSLLKSLRPLPGGGGLSGVSVADCPLKIKTTDTDVVHSPISNFRVFTGTISSEGGLSTSFYVD